MRQTLPDVVRNIISAVRRRMDTARAAGGVTDLELVERGGSPPATHWHDPLTCTWIPDHVDLLPVPRDLIRDVIHV